MLTVLNAQKAQRFLDTYGSAARKGSMRASTLRYMDRDLLCSLSKFEPDEWLLETLRKDAKDNENQIRLKASTGGSTEQFERKFDYTWLQCGIWDYQTTDLVFVTQVMARREGSIMFGKENRALMTHSVDVGQSTY